MKTHQINVTPGEYAAIVSYEETDFVELLRPANERYEIGDVLHLREFAKGWGVGRNCYRKVVNIIEEPRGVDASLGRMAGLVLNVYFGERPGLEFVDFKAIPRAVEVESLLAA